MHCQRKFTVSLFDITLCSFIAHSKNCKWVETLNVVERHHSGVIEEPHVQEESSNKAFLNEWLFENVGACLPSFNGIHCMTCCTLTRTWKWFKFQVSINQRLEGKSSHDKRQKGKEGKREKVERRIVIL